jgi:hypothetical protein
MATRKKVDVVTKPKVTKPRTKQVTAPKECSDIEMAMKLGAVFIRYGSHLTVTSYPDGRQELKWDDEALLNEVREAIASVEVK